MHETPASVERVRKYGFNFEIYRLKNGQFTPISPTIYSILLRAHVAGHRSDLPPVPLSPSLPLSVDVSVSVSLSPFVNLLASILDILREDEIRDFGPITGDEARLSTKLLL